MDNIYVANNPLVNQKKSSQWKLKNVRVGHFWGPISSKKVKFLVFFVHFSPFDHQMKENVKINQLFLIVYLQGFISTQFLIISSITKILHTIWFFFLEGWAFLPRGAWFSRGKNARSKKRNLENIDVLSINFTFSNY